MFILSSTTTMFTMSTNTTLVSISTTEHIFFSSYDPNIFKRLLIIFGSICSLWLIMGLIFVSIQTYRHLKNKTQQKFFRSHRSLPTIPMEQIIKEDHISDSDDDDQTSVLTSVSFFSERSKSIPEHSHPIPPCERIPEEEFELKSSGISNIAFSQSTLTSSIDVGPSLLYYPACRNFAYSQSTLASSADLNTPTPSIILPSPSKPSSTRFIHLKRHSSQSSTTTAFSQITSATYLSSSSTSTSSNVPTASIKPIPLPTVMITDCDRLQTDIIELEDFEPEKDWRRARPELRLLLNDSMPQAVR